MSKVPYCLLRHGAAPDYDHTDLVRQECLACRDPSPWYLPEATLTGYCPRCGVQFERFIIPSEDSHQHRYLRAMAADRNFDVTIRRTPFYEVVFSHDREGAHTFEPFSRTDITDRRKAIEVWRREADRMGHAFRGWFHNPYWVRLTARRPHQEPRVVLGPVYVPGDTSCPITKPE